MRISRICIERPVLATVMSLVIALFGLISLSRLQNRELPDRMFFSTLLTFFIAPATYVAVDRVRVWIRSRWGAARPQTPSPAAAAGP